MGGLTLPLAATKLKGVGPPLATQRRQQLATPALPEIGAGGAPGGVCRRPLERFCLAASCPMSKQCCLITTPCPLATLAGLGIAVAAAATEIDYADSRFVDSWLRHPVYGDPSFDSFKRFSGNPVHTGAPRFGWPVNGFFFADPAGGNWYLYIGDYATGYLGPPPEPVHPLPFAHHGQTWENLARSSRATRRMFDKNGHTPDVSVVFAEGRYHMVYDWGEPNFKRRGRTGLRLGRETGRPLAPRRAADHAELDAGAAAGSLPPDLCRDGAAPQAGLADPGDDGQRAASLGDVCDDRRPAARAVLGTAAGPQRRGRLLPSAADGVLPGLRHDGWVYAPATSVARNRDFQVLFPRRWKRRPTRRRGRYSVTVPAGTRRMCHTRHSASGARRSPVGWTRRGLPSAVPFAQFPRQRDDQPCRAAVVEAARRSRFSSQRSSAPVFTKKDMPDTFHAVVLRPKTGPLVVNSLDVGG